MEQLENNLSLRKGRRSMEWINTVMSLRQTDGDSWATMSPTDEARVRKSGTYGDLCLWEVIADVSGTVAIGAADVENRADLKTVGELRVVRLDLFQPSITGSVLGQLRRSNMRKRSLQNSLSHRLRLESRLRSAITPAAICRDWLAYIMLQDLAH